MFRVADRTVHRGPWSRAWFDEKRHDTLYLGPLTITRESWPTHRINHIIEPPTYERRGVQWIITLRWRRGGEWQHPKED